MKNKKIIASIEARMTSTRLPGKVLKKFCNDKPMLQVLIERLQASHFIDEIVVATTVNATDDPIVSLCDDLGTSYYRGSEDNVLSRVVGAAASVHGDIIVEITGDCPLMDPQVVDYVIHSYLKNAPEVDYVSNSGLGDLQRHLIPLGMDVQVFAYKDLAWINAHTNDPDDQEHVSLYFYRDGSRNNYRLLSVPIPAKWQRDYPVRLTLDTAEDLTVIRKIYEALYRQTPPFSLEDILCFCDRRREITTINSNVAQKRPKGFKHSDGR